MLKTNYTMNRYSESNAEMYYNLYKMKMTPSESQAESHLVTALANMQALISKEQAGAPFNEKVGRNR